MLAQATQNGSTVLLFSVLLVAVYKDVCHHRIPNWLSFGALFAGLVLSFVFLPFERGYESFLGAFVGFALFLPFYLLGGMGAGDVKLMAAVGSLVGPYSVFMAVLYTLIVGGCVAIFVILYSGELVSFYRRYMVMILARTLIPAEEGSIAKRRFPYALSIAIGTLIALGLEGQLDFIPIGAWVSQLPLAGGFQ